MGVMENGSEGPDIELFRDSARKFFQHEIRPHGERWRKAGVVDREAFLKAGEMGFLCLWADEKYGGQILRGFSYDDRKRVESGKRLYCLVAPGGRPIITTK